MSCRKRTLSILVAVALVAISGTTYSADGTWTQTGAGPFDWGTPGNWSGNTVATDADSTAFLIANITADQTINLDANRIIGNIIFTDSGTSSNNLTISGANILTLDVTTGAPVIGVTQSVRTLTIASVVAGTETDGLTKIGIGTLALTGANTYNGTTTINAGTLDLGGGTSAGSLASTSLALGGGTLNYSRNDSQTKNFTTTAINSGASTVSASAGNTLGLGDITRSTGGTLNIGTTGTITTSDSNDATGILGPWVFYGNQYATVSSSTFGGYTGTTQNTESNWTSATTNYEITTTGTKTLTDNRTGNTFRYSGTNTGGIALGASGSNTLTTNGIFNAGTNTFTISRAGGTGSVIAGSTGEIVVAGPSNVTISAPISSGAVTYSGTGTLTLSGANTYSGGFTFNSGTVGGISNGTYEGFGSGLVTIAGSSCIVDGISSTFTVSNDLKFQNLTVHKATVTWEGNVELAGNATYTSGISTTIANSTFSGDISGDYSLSTAGSFPSNSAVFSTLTLSGNNTFSGGLNWSSVSRMALNLNSATALGTGTFTISNSHALDNTSGTAITLTTNNAITMASNLTFTGTNDLNLGNGAVTINANRQVTVIANTLTVGGGIGQTGGARTLTKLGAGTLVVGGSSSYTGTTTVSAGTLLVNGTHTGGGTYTVASGATLGGTGSIGTTAVTVNGIIAPGASIESLATGNVTWNGGAVADPATTWLFELGPGNTADLLNITGNFTRGPGSVFEFDFADSTATGNFTLVTWTGSSNFSAGNFTYTNLGGGNTGNFTISGNSLQFVVVPEPDTLALAAGALAGLAGYRRYRRQRVG